MVSKHSAEKAASCDVVVIGAGAAGIAAATELVRAGRSTIVLEARDRPGGRAFTRSVGGQAYDAGAAYIHFGDRNPWIALAEELGVETPRHRGWGGGPLYRAGRRLDDAETREIRDARAGLWERLEAAGETGADLSLGELVAGEGHAMAMAATRFGQQAIGEDPGLIGVHDLATQWNGNDRVIPAGYGTLVGLAARGLPIRYGVRALALDWSGAGVRVETPSGTVTAGRAIVTVPLGILKAGGLRFTPALPSETAAAIATLSMGALTKVALALNGERFGLSAPSDMSDADGPFVFELFPFGRDLVLATIGGTPARDLAALGEAGAVAATLDALATMLGGGVRRHVVAGQLSSWWQDPLALGSYSVAGPGGHAARHVLARPVGERLIFAGEATSGGGDTVGGAMTVGGATLAGRMAAAWAMAPGQD